MKTLIRYFFLDTVSTIFMLITLALAISYVLGLLTAGYWLFGCVLFILRGIIWQGKYVDRIRELENVIEILNKK
jgi:hypothetical protein